MELHYLFMNVFSNLDFEFPAKTNGTLFCTNFPFLVHCRMLNLQFIELISIFKMKIFIENEPNVMYRIFACSLCAKSILFLCIRNMHFDFYDYRIGI